MLVAVVTGASRGLGREIALGLGKRGHAVVVNYRHAREEAEEVVKLLGGQAMAARADVGKLRQVEDMAALVYERWGRVDAVINNAGIAKDGILMKYPEDYLNEVLDVNLKGCFHTAKAFVPYLVRSGGGHIVNMSSYSGVRGKSGQAAYSASKAGMLGFTYAAAKELSRYNIRVNAVLPGYLPTEMGKGAEKAMEGARHDSILSTLSDPRETADFVAWLFTTTAITGQVFSLESRL